VTRRQVWQYRLHQTMKHPAEDRRVKTLESLATNTTGALVARLIAIRLGGG